MGAAGAGLGHGGRGGHRGAGIGIRARIPAMETQAGLAVVITEHGAGEAEIGDRQQQQLLLVADVTALVDDPAWGEGDAAAADAQPVRTHQNLRLTLQHHEDRFVRVAMLFIAGSGRDGDQARIQSLQTLKGKAVHLEIDPQATVVVVVVDRQGRGASLAGQPAEAAGRGLARGSAAADAGLQGTWGGRCGHRGPCEGAGLESVGIGAAIPAAHRAA